MDPAWEEARKGQRGRRKGGRDEKRKRERGKGSEIKR